jgi:SAM-dependent methyltransferase
MTDHGELSTGRDFRVYKAGMDASLAVKIADICTHVRPGTIVDKGCGTGKLLVHLSALWPESRILGLDISTELLHTAAGQPFPHPNASIVKGDIIQRHFPPGSVATVIFSSVIHEVFSYNGYDRESVRLALRNTRMELEPAGRVVIRDGVRPAAGTVWMRCGTETESRFRRFARDFKGRSATPGVTFIERVHDGQRWFILTTHAANEFLSKKDYLENWSIEVNEEFGVFTLHEWQCELKAMGYRILEARSYASPWIFEHRYRGRIWLHADAGDHPGEELPFPDTTAVIVGEAV